MNKKHTYVRKCTTFLRKFTKKVSAQPTRRDKNVRRPNFVSYKCTVNSKNKVIISNKKLYRMYLRHLVK